MKTDKQKMKKAVLTDAYIGDALLSFYFRMREIKKTGRCVNNPSNEKIKHYLIRDTEARARVKKHVPFNIFLDADAVGTAFEAYLFNLWRNGHRYTAIKEVILFHDFTLKPK